MNTFQPGSEMPVSFSNRYYIILAARLRLALISDIKYPVSCRDN